ncbi:unnamed protein product [Coregonus sp. 'balchen']|nr:unnamed protein product [Coregonus sp. 'balchen']
MMMMMMMMKMRTAAQFRSQLWSLKTPSLCHRSFAAISTYKAVIFDMYGVLIPSPVKVATGGEVNAWKRFMRGELGAEEFVEAFGRQCSEIIVESCREGLSKPDPRIYHLCLNRLGVSAHEAVFLDDLEFNVKAAAQLGMHAIKVGDLAVAVKELEGVLGIPLSGPSQSNSLYHLTTGGRHLLLRKQQKGSQAMETEYSVLGAPFLLMEVCLGRMFSDPSLPGLTPGDRRALYQAMEHTLCQIHRLDTTAVGLEDYGEPEKPEVVAVLDWGRSNLGDPLSDLTFSCMARCLPQDNPLLTEQLGIPSVEEVIGQYSSSMGLEEGVPDWQFYMAFHLFCLAASHQGESKNTIAGALGREHPGLLPQPGNVTLPWAGLDRPWS